MPKFADGPKNSQGGSANPLRTGHTNRPLYKQLLDYSDGEFTEQVVRAWRRETPLEEKKAMVEKIKRGEPVPAEWFALLGRC
jgi:hypothetical protein